MKLKYPFEIVEMDNSFVAVPVADECDFHGVLRVNESARIMLDLLSQETDSDMIVKALAQEFDADENTLRESLDEFLDGLRAEGLIIE